MKFGAHEIEVTVRAQCKSMRLHYRPSDHRMSLSVPKQATQKDIERFLNLNRAWIEERLRDAPTWQPSYAVGERHRLLGRYVTLGQDGVPTGEEALKQYRKAALTEVLNRMIPVWETRMHVHVNRVTIREMTSRWGSCRADRATLSMNLKLACLPPECIEQVLVHELCHLFHQNHSATFYAEMTRFLPDWRARDAQIKAFEFSPLPPL